MKTSFTLQNHTCFNLGVQDVVFNGYDYWGNEDPSQLKGALLPPHSEKTFAFSAYWGANGHQFTLTVALGDGSRFTMTADPGATVNGPVQIQSIATGAIIPQVESTGTSSDTVFTVRQSLPDMASWMTALPQQVRDQPLSQLMLAATHDSGTSTTSTVASPKAKTQDWTIMEQLQHGIRVFDIRVKVKSGLLGGISLVIAHGIADMAITYEDVIRDFHTFLDDHPKECIVMLCNQETKDGADASGFAALIEKANVDLGTRFYTGSGIPSINQAKGTIVLLRRYPGDGGISLVDWPDDTQNIYEGYMNNYTFYTQDYSNATLEDKQQHVSRAFGFNTKDGQPVWLLNYNTLAVWIVSWSKIRDYSDPMNAWLLDYLGKHDITAATLFLDFPSDRLIQQIVGCNFSVVDQPPIIAGPRDSRADRGVAPPASATA
jgi:hypothetical protein